MSDRPARSPWLLPLTNLVAFLGVVVVNALANALPIAGRNTGEISALYPTLFTPAGYVFSIWGVIYLALGAFVVFGMLPGGRRHVARVGYAFALSCVFNMSWIVAWHHLRIGTSLLLMLGLLASLIVVYRRASSDSASPSAGERWAMRFPFSLYLGWITVATVANVSVWLTDLGWRGAPLPERVWAALVVVVATGIGGLALWRERDVVFALVLVWALVGIAVARADTAALVSTVSLACAALLVLAVGLAWRSRGGSGTSATASP